MEDQNQKSGKIVLKVHIENMLNSMVTIDVKQHIVDTKYRQFRPLHYLERVLLCQRSGRGNLTPVKIGKFRKSVV